MATPQLTPQQIAQVSGLVARFIRTQGDAFFCQAVPLSAAQHAAMNRFFAPRLLDAVRVVVLNGIRVQNPPFYPMLVAMGFTNLPDFSQMAAITFYDVAVSHERFGEGLLFHELVHVEQYRQLGVPCFAELYVRGFLAGGSYDSIPMEANAYIIGGRYEGNPAQHFSVADEVRRWIAEGWF